MAIKNQKIDFFEQFLDERSLVQGELLFENGNVKFKSESSEFIFAFEVSDLNKYVCNIKYVSSKIKEYSCTCPEIQESLICPHIAASLFSLRKKIALEVQRARRKQKVYKNSKRYGDFSKIPEEELFSFLQSHFRRDKRFSIWFKIRFLKYLYEEEDPGIYKKLLDSIIPPVTTVASALKGNDILFFHQIAEEMLRQYEDSFALEKYTIAYAILGSLLDKSNYILHYSELYLERIFNLNIRLHRCTDDLLNQSLAPELRTKLFGFCIGLIKSSYYNIADLQNNLYETLFNHAISDEEREKISKILGSNYKSSKTDQNIELYFQLYRLIQAGKSIEIMASEFMSLRSELKKQIIRPLLQKLSGERARLFLEYLIENCTYNLKEYLQLMLELTVHNEKDEEYIKYSCRLYGMSGDKRILVKLKSQFPKKFKSVEQYLLEAHSNQEIKTEKIVRFYHHHKRTKKLMTSLSQSEDLELLMKYDDILFEQYSMPLTVLYSDFLKQYFKQYAGPRSTPILQKVWQHLRNHNKFNMIRAISHKLYNEMEYRPSIKNELKRLGSL